MPTLESQSRNRMPAYLMMVMQFEFERPLGLRRPAAALIARGARNVREENAWRSALGQSGARPPQSKEALNLSKRINTLELHHYLS